MSEGDRLERRLAAVWFADIVGFTPLADSDEDAALQIVAEFQAAARVAVEGRGGRVVKFLGDGALAEFSSARSALDSALALSASFSAENAPARTPIRIGLHVGEVAGAPDGDLYGDGVNLASRLQAVAAPGEVVVSEDAARALRHSRGFAFDPLGDRQLKGYGEPVQAFRARRAERDTESAPRARRTEPRAGRIAERSIAVLPFANLSANPEHEYFSDGVTEEILTSLARIEGLKVISRTSAMQYKGTTRSVKEIGRELGVASVLEGSVRHATGRVRISAQLVDAVTDAHLWAERYDRDLEDIFAIQADVAERIVEALQGRLSSRDRARLASPGTINRAAYEETLRGRWFANRRTPENLARAMDHFERATESDPEYAPAHAGIAIVSILHLYWARPGPRVVRDRALGAAERAIALDPGLSEPWAARAMVRIFDRDWDAADADFQRALEVGPGDAQARQWRAHLLACLGRYAEAIAEIDRALELDPLSLTVITEAGNVRYLARRYEESFTYYRQAIDLDPGFKPARYKLFESYLPLGRVAEAMEEARALDRLDPWITEGTGPEAERRFVEALASVATVEDGWPLFYAAAAKASLGRVDEALADLETARDQGDWYLVRTAVAPQLDVLRGHPRYEALLVSLGLSGIPLPDAEAGR